MEFGKIVKLIRQKTKYSQTELAERLGVSFATVNRWENGKSLPNKLAEMQLYEICKASQIDLFDDIVADFEANDNGNGLVLYHGSKSGIVGEISPVSREHCDFGKGFYMGTQVSQPLTLICAYDKSKLYTVTLDLTGLKVLTIPTDIEWAMAVAFSRGKLDSIKGKPLYKRCEKMLKGYDVIVGSIANDRMFYVLDRFFMGDITDKGLVESLAALQLGKQYVAMTEKACKQVTIIKEETICEIERLFIQEVSARNRRYGIDTANEICKTYRREGKYFDELLEDGE